MENIPTPHISAGKDDFAPTVLMPGDPKRSTFIAKNFLSEVKLVNDVRGAQGYTGKYNGKRVSVMASGMGMPSMGIYSYELYHFYNVEAIIRIGSAGAFAEGLKLYDLILAQAACTDSNFINQFALPGSFAPIADFQLLTRAAGIAESAKMNFHVGNVVSSDRFYDESEGIRAWKKMGVLAVEMEAAALYATAARCAKKALCICTVSDLPMTGESLSSKDRQQSFQEMARLALECAI